MRDLLVAVLEVCPATLRAGLAEVDRPGHLLRDAASDRGEDLVADVRAVLSALSAVDLGPRLLALAVGVGPAVADREVTGLLSALTSGDGGWELSVGWPLPSALPVVAGPASTWEAAGAAAPEHPMVAGAVLTAARAVGAHAHLPHA